MTPRQAAELLQEGLALHQAGRLAEAESRYLRVRRALPKNFDAVHLGGTVALQQGRLRDAAALLSGARRLDPRSAACALRLGVVRLALGQPAEAERELDAALALDADLPEAWFHLGRARESLGRPDESLAALERAIAIRPDYAEALDALGAALLRARGPEAAESPLRRATESDPRLARAWCNLGVCLVYRGGLGEALAAFDRALALDPSLHHAQAGRGLALERCYRTPEAVEAYGAAIRGDPNNLQARSARLMALHYLPGVSRENLFREHREFGAACDGALSLGGGSSLGPVRKPGNAVDPLPTGCTSRHSASGGRLRVGFLSPNFRAHAVASFFEPLLGGLDRGQFELYLYHDHGLVDETSGRLRAMADGWRQVAGLPAEAFEARVRADQLDVLVDLAGHTEINRLASLARRLATAQVTYLGYPDTTGIPAMDFRLVDPITDPEGEADALATEKLIRFSPTAWCFRPSPDAPEPRLPPGARGGAPVFGCFNNFAKVTDPVLEAWARVLSSVPDSILVLKSFGLGHDSIQASARLRLRRAGIDPGRARLVEHTDSLSGHLAAYGGIDVALDTFPYQGTTTTCEALWMGVPVVSLAGDRHASRVGVSLLRAIGRPEWIASTVDDYVVKAAGLARNRERIASERGALREAMRRSALLDHAGQARRFGQALQACFELKAGSPEPSSPCSEERDCGERAEPDRIAHLKAS